MSDGNGVQSSRSVLSSDGGNFSSLCPNGSEWIWYGLGECTQDARDMASVVLGLLSIACFIVSSLPQYYSSCKTGNMDSALSIWFLLFWLAGDTCNLTGSFLAEQLPLQKYTAVYYVLADLLMLSMYTYYWFKNKSSYNLPPPYHHRSTSMFHCSNNTSCACPYPPSTT